MTSDGDRSGHPSPSAGASSSFDGDAPPSICFMMAINSFAFSYSLIVCTLGVVVLPEEAVRLFRDQHAMMLGVMLGCTGVTQLISPAIGYISDRSTSRHGRRRPLLAAGAVIACVGCAAMSVARERMLRYAYIGALTCALAGMNISYACYTALLPDLIAAPHMGRASGSMATMSMLGALCGFSLFGFWLPTAHAYSIYAMATVVTVSITCLVAHEVPHAEKPSEPSCTELLASYSIDAAGAPDFFWVFVTRTFYYMGISLQAFVLFMLRDVQQVGRPPAAGSPVPAPRDAEPRAATRRRPGRRPSQALSPPTPSGGQPDVLHVAARDDRPALGGGRRHPERPPVGRLRAQAARLRGVRLHGDRLPRLREHTRHLLGAAARRRVRATHGGRIPAQRRHAAGARLPCAARR